MILKGESAEEFNRKADENYEKFKARQKQNLIDMMEADEELGLYEQPIAEDAKVDLQEFAIWMTGCGYDFTQHEYYMKNKHLLTDQLKDNGLREAAEKVVERMDLDDVSYEIAWAIEELKKALKQ